jgi:hypothetical protein
MMRYWGGLLWAAGQWPGGGGQQSAQAVVSVFHRHAEDRTTEMQSTYRCERLEAASGTEGFDVFFLLLLGRWTYVLLYWARIQGMPRPTQPTL